MHHLVDDRKGRKMKGSHKNPTPFVHAVRKFAQLAAAAAPVASEIDFRRHLPIVVL